MDFRRGSGLVAPGRVGLLLLAAAIVPIVLKQFRPAARRIGEVIEDFGKGLQDFSGPQDIEAVEIVEEAAPSAAAEAPPTAEPAAEPKAATEAPPKSGRSKKKE